MWSRVNTEFFNDFIISQWISDYVFESFKNFRLLNLYFRVDSRRRIVMNSKKQILFCFFWIWLTKFSNRIRALLMIEDVSLISKFYHYMNELIMIKRSIAFVLQFNDVTIVSMRFMIFHHEVRTVKLIYTNEKVAESQWIHKLHVRSIFHIDMRFFMLTFNFREFNDVFKKWKNDDFSQFNAVDTFSHVMTSLRYLTIASCSLLLSKLDRMLKKVSNLIDWRKNELLLLSI